MYSSGNEEEEEEVNDSDSDEQFNSDECESSPPKKKRKRTIDNELFKNKVLGVLTKGADAAAGGFVISGKLENAPIAVISVKNANKMIKCPLYENEVGGIIESFEQSPYGRGSATVVDTSVRNSWQLSPEGFEILNPNWNTYIETVLKQRIIAEMLIQTDFESSLYKLLLYKAGSFFKPHRDSEKAEGMFATLVVQLPSKYAGGQLVVNHDGKSETVDFSSSGADYKEFSTFFSVFYCDCEHEILPVTEGYRLCLIYNLISKKSDCIPVAPRKNVLETELLALLENQKTPWKLVYALTHKYSESNLSYENLKTTDIGVADLLRSVSKTFGLNIYLTIFNKDSSGKGEGDEEGYYGCQDADFDSGDEDYLQDVTYDVKKFKSVIGPAIPPSFKLNVDFEEDVIPEDTFDNIEPYEKSCQPTGNEGIDINKYYRSAAIVFWPEELTLQVFLDGGAPDKDVDALFLGEIKKCRIKGKYESSSKHLLGFATAIVESTKYRSNNIPRFNAIIALDNLELVQKLFHRCVTLNAETIPLLRNQCEKYGWKPFSDAIAEMFKQQSILDAVTKLNLLVGNDKLKKDQIEVCHSLFKRLMAKEDSSTTYQRQSYFGYRPLTKRNIKENQDYLYSVGVVAQKVQFAKSEIIEIFKKEPFSDIVPVLIRLLSPRSNDKNDYWKDVAKHFIVEVEKETSKPVIANSWKREIPQGTCACVDCIALDKFLREDKQSESFKIGEKRRKHIQTRVKTMQNISEETEQSKGKIGVLILKKTQKSGYDEMQKNIISLELLRKLRSAMPK